MAVEIMLSVYLCGSFAARIRNLDPRLRCVVSYMCLALYFPVSNKEKTGRAPTDSVKGVRKKKLAASSMLHEAKTAYYAFDVIVYCMYTHQTRIAYTKRTH